MLVDAHCHLVGRRDDEGKYEFTLDRAKKAGVTGFVAVGTDLEDSVMVLQMARRHPEVRASLGVHPHEARTWEAGSLEALTSLLTQPEVLFVGETGLDWHYDLSPREVQEAVFREQIRLARRIGKPLMIHTRSAPRATLDILREEEAGSVGGIIHCFSEDLAFAREALDLGFHLSFSGILTFKNAQAIQAVAAWAPLDRLLVETDAPYLAPVPHRGKPNEPAYVTYVAEGLGKLRGLSAAAIGERTTRNLEALCGWSPSS